MASLIGFIAVSGLLWAAYDWAWQKGYDTRETKLEADTAAIQARLDEARADLRVKEQALERAEQDRDALERKLTDEAIADPNAGSDGLGLDSLRRLNRIR